MLVAALTASCSDGESSGLEAHPPSVRSVTAAPPRDEAPRTTGRGSSDVSDAIAASGPPTAGGVAQDGTALLVYSSQPAEKTRRKQPAAFRVFDRRGVAFAQGLVPRHRIDGSYTVHGDRHGFLLLDPWYRSAFYVTRSGRVTEVPLDGPPTDPRPGDLLVDGASRTGWIFRPSTRRVHRRVMGPPGASVTHVDGHGVWWALGQPENGQTVVFSAMPGEPWTKHLIGVWSDPDNGCVCSASPGPVGRGSVITVVGDSIAHVSLDHGETWTTWDITGTEPDRLIRSGQRFPHIGALPDGRLLVYYMQYWVARDATNTSFTRLGPGSSGDASWLAGVSDGLLTRPGEVSPDGGGTWLPVS